MSKFAWVTLATNDAYSLGALVLANSLKRAGTAHQLVVMVTPGVTDAMKSRLQATFNVVKEVNVMDSKDAANLALLSRPDLGITFTKLNCWRLTDFEKCVFLDADTLVIQKCDELFEREEFSAAPDVGWPDCFNSGVFVYKPSNETFQKLTEFALEKGSFDGGDQGLLNLFFSDWATKDISKHLPFVYNTCTTAMYSYLPAFKQFGKDVKILHFIGQLKPWLVNFDSSTRKVFTPQEYGHLTDFLQLWWNIFCDQVHPQLTTEMAGLAGALAKLTLGAPRTAEQEAYENQMRRQCWESEQEIATKREEERKKLVEKCVAAGKFPPGNPTFWDKPDNANVEFVKEKLPDGRTVHRKIISYHGIETEETEETEEIEVDGKIVSQKVKNSEPKKQIIVKKDAEKAKEMPADVKSFLESEILETDKVERDEKTNTTTVTRKTATGYQQKIITVDEHGKTKTQIKTFYDPVEIAGEEEEEEEEIEETETLIPAAKKTTIITTTKKTLPSTTSTITEQTKLGTETEVKTDTSTSTVTTASDKSDTDKKNETVVAEKSPKGEPVEKIIYEIDAQGRQIQKKITVYPGDESEVTETSQDVQKADVSKKITTEVTTTTTKTATTVKSSDVKDQSTVSDKTDDTADGKEKITTVISEDGKTKTIIKTIEKPEVVEEYEEVVPAKVTLTKTVDTTKDSGDITKANVKTSENTSSSVDSKTSTESKQTSSESSVTETKKTTTTTTTTQESTSSTVKSSESKATKESKETKKSQDTKKKTTEQEEEDDEEEEEEEVDAEGKKTGQVIKTTTKKSTKTTKKGVKKVKEVPAEGEGVTTCEEIKIEGGVKKIYTTVYSNGAKRVQTKTFYDAVEVPSNDPSIKPGADRPAGTNADGDVTTVEEKKIEGGTTFIYTTTRPDGTKKVETKTFYDAVEVPVSDEEEEEEEPEKEPTPPPSPPPKLPKLPSPPPPEKKPMTKEEEEAEISRIKVMQLKKKLGLTDDSAPPPPKRDFSKGKKPK